MKLNKLAAATIGVGMTLSATVVGVATPAAAASTCNTWKSSDRATGYAKCSGGNTRFSIHRVKVVCISPRGTTHTIYGDWVSTRNKKTSKAVCTTDPVRTGIEVYRLSVETDEPV
ncbi:hypothetical protein [Streptomyces sp.]|uniref:hypothetical protein n=1 Tax=Streptomyces sp. TaxID=1931 RepID=UPI002D77BFDA|nr:hypothetical protein [Streptomyces sp.]HET6354117.1 hypothetical protein [Streptomyces sp.]